MLDQIDLDRALDKREYKRNLRTLQQSLYDMEQALFETRIPALIVLEGWAGTGKIGLIRRLTRRLDPRGLRVHPITPPRTYEQQYPWLYRFWLKTPSYGRMAIFDRSWYRELLAGRTERAIGAQQWRERCEDIAAFERQLADDGAIIVKFWLHISKHEQRRRFRKLLADRLTAWQVTDEDRRQNKRYGRMYDAVEDLLARTDAPYAPWAILPATSNHYARVAAFETILAAFESRLGPVSAPAGAHEEAFDDSGAAIRRGLDTMRARAAPLLNDEGRRTKELLSSFVLRPSSSVQSAVATSADACSTSLVPAPHPSVGILGRVDLTRRLDQKEYEQKLDRLQAKIHLLGFEVYSQKRPVVLVFEGWDAAGKGGAIQRITEKLDPRGFVVHAIAAPSGDDKAHHYLYRFWRRLPPRGAIAIFDRSWYGRVLVERVEGFARPDEWQRAYAEINEFERQLVEFGTIICKFWVHLSPEEQLRRFEERQNVPYKAWKLTDEDWRNREKWPQYEQAADEMLMRTSTPAAPWTIVESEDKRFGRIKALQTVVLRLEDELGKVKL
jgi:polyphosphate kinase 2 (PPK2 family)